MKEEIFEEVLDEILKELKDNNRLMHGLIGKVTTLIEKVDTFGQQLSNQQVIAPPADTAPLQKVAADAITDIGIQVAASMKKINDSTTASFQKIHALVEAQPKPIVRQLRFLFFPENDYNGIYRFFLTRMLLWLTILIGMAMLFTLGREYVNRPETYHPFQETHTPSVTPAPPQGPARQKTKTSNTPHSHPQKQPTTNPDSAIRFVPPSHFADPPADLPKQRPHPASQSAHLQTRAPLTRQALSLLSARLGPVQN